MKKLFASVLSIVLVFTSSVFAAYVPTEADADIKAQLTPNIEALVSSDVNRLVGIANKIVTLLPNFDSNGRVYHILEWVYDTIVVSVEAEKTERAQAASQSDMDDMDDDMMDDDMDDDMMDDDMMDDDMDDDDMMDDDMQNTSRVFDITSESYKFSLDEIVVNV